MKINPKYTQIDCKESKEPDFRQANAVKKLKPDIIILEYPNDNPTPSLEFNNFPAEKKPARLTKPLLRKFSPAVLKIHPWAVSDNFMWRNVLDHWNAGHQIMIYSVDAPPELTSEWLEVWNHMYPCAKKNWLWWVQIYLRERIMANHVSWILDNYSESLEPTTLVFLQKFHWDHVKFLMANDSPDKIWDYYFGKFDEIDRETIRARIDKNNKVFLKYWDKYSDFV